MGWGCGRSARSWKVRLCLSLQNSPIIIGDGTEIRCDRSLVSAPTEDEARGVRHDRHFSAASNFQIGVSRCRAWVQWRLASVSHRLRPTRGDARSPLRLCANPAGGPRPSISSESRNGYPRTQRSSATEPGFKWRTGKLVPQSAGESAFRSSRAKRVERVSQENADDEKDTQCRDYLRHRLAHWRAMPGSAALRNSR